MANRTRWPAWQARIAIPIARVTKSRVPRCAMVSRLRPRAWSKSNSSNDLRDGKRAALMRPSPPWDSRADTSRCRHAARNSS
ncbi:Uncharacterised protein [Mycobacterium tuberculosis]|nr:Uncharacterised protein [Mycobacterium tuberculosis]